MAIALRRWRVRLLLLAVLALGMARGSPSNVEFPQWLILRAQGIDEVTGTVVSYPSLGARHVTFTVRPDHLPADLRVTWFTEASTLGRIHYGDRLILSGTTRLPEPFEGFDYPEYLARRGVFATMLVDGDTAVEHLGFAGNLLLRAGDRTRQVALDRLEDALTGEGAALAQGLLLGDRSALTDEIEDAFRRTGLMHVLAVSGLHLGILLAGAWFLLRRLGARPAIVYPVVGLMAAFFLWIVGPRVSLLRATLLLGFVGLGSVLADLGWILRRTVRPANGLAVAAVVLLAIRPTDLLDVGFQLSFAATAGILLLVSGRTGAVWAACVDRTAERLGRMAPVARSGLALLGISAAAQAAVTPILAFHFGVFHPLLLGLNLLAIPLVTVVLWIGFPTALLVAFGAPAVLAIPLGWLLEGLSSLIQALARMPLVEMPVAPWIGLWMVGLLACALATRRYVSESS